jgi:Na+-transporting NADH:ubiquinone oxidoreductase subunit NqrB
MVVCVGVAGLWRAFPQLLRQKVVVEAFLAAAVLFLLMLVPTLQALVTAVTVVVAAVYRSQVTPSASPVQAALVL